MFAFFLRKNPEIYLKMGIAYLNKKNDEKIEVSYSSELLKQIFRYKVPKRVLKTNAQIITVREILFTSFVQRIRQIQKSRFMIKLN